MRVTRQHQRIVEGVIVGLVVAIAIWGFKLITGKLNKGVDTEGLEVGNNVTLSDNEVQLIVNDLVNAMNKIGTDEAAIYDALERCYTADDMLAVIKAFGVKKYNGNGLEENTWLLWLAREMDLKGWLRAELNRWQQKKVEEIFLNLGMKF